MTPKSWMTLSALLNRYHAGTATEPQRFLPKSEAAEAEQHAVGAKGLNDFVIRPSAFMKRVHYSWLLPLVQETDPITGRLYLSSLDEKSSTSLRKLTHDESALLPIPERFKAFLRRHLYKRLVRVPDLLPPAFLAPSPLKPLITLEKAQLLTLIDFLGVYDLAPQMAGHIDQKRLNALFSSISEDKRIFLQQLLARKKKVPANRRLAPDVTLDKKTIANWIHRSGLLRLALALKGQHPSLLWHLSRLLDSGRANILEAQLAKLEANEQQQADASKLVEEVMQHLRYA